jgi:hypothetical protein
MKISKTFVLLSLCLISLRSTGQRLKLAPVVGANFTFTTSKSSTAPTSVFLFGSEEDVLLEMRFPPGIGFHVGGLVDYKWKEKLSLQSGLILNVKTYAINTRMYDREGTGEDLVATSKSRAAIHYLEIPLLVTYRVGNSGFKLTAGVTPGFAVRASNKGKVKDDDRSESMKYRMNIGSDPNWHQILPVDVSLQAGIGKDVEIAGRTFELSVFAQPSLTYLMPQGKSDKEFAAKLINSGVRVAHYFAFPSLKKR